MKLFALAVLATLAASAAAAVAPTYVYPYTPISKTDEKAVSYGQYAVKMLNYYPSLQKKVAGAKYHEEYDYTYGYMNAAYHYEEGDYHYYKLSVKCHYGPEDYDFDYVVRYHKPTNKYALVKVTYHNNDYYGCYDEQYSYCDQYQPYKVREYEDGEDYEHYGETYCKVLSKNSKLATKLYGYGYKNCKIVKVIKAEYYEEDGYNYYRMNLYYKYNDQYYTHTVIMYTPPGYKTPQKVVYVSHPYYDGGVYSYGGSRKLAAAYDYRYASGYSYVPYKYYSNDDEVVQYLKEALKVLKKNRAYYYKAFSYYKYFSCCFSDGKVYELEDEPEYYHINYIKYAKDKYTYWYGVNLKYGPYYYPMDVMVYWPRKGEWRLYGIGIPENANYYYPYTY